MPTVRSIIERAIADRQADVSLWHGLFRRSNERCIALAGRIKSLEVELADRDREIARLTGNGNAASIDGQLYD